MAKSTKPGGSASRFKEFFEWFDAATRERGWNYAVVSKEAGIAPSTISMLLKRKRLPSAKVAVRLARVLCPPGQDVGPFTERLLAIVGRRADHHLTYESTENRILRTKEIKVGYIRYPPFVNPPGQGDKGFAVELFERVAANVCRGSVYRLSTNTYDFSDLELAVRESDIVVSGLIPTFRRCLFMSFSSPLPYLRVPLTALARRGSEVSVDDILDWKARPAKHAAKRLLLIEGEVGAEFANIFLGVDSNDKQHALSMKHVSNSQFHSLCETLVNEDAVLLSDLATCAAVRNYDHERLAAVARGSSSPENLQSSGFPFIANYRVAFGAKKDDMNWLKLVNDALTSLLTEGMQVTRRLYKKYFASSPLFLSDDDLVIDREVKDAFNDLKQDVNSNR